MECKKCPAGPVSATVPFPPCLCSPRPLFTRAVRGGTFRREGCRGSEGHRVLKSAVAGKQSVSSGQTTATAGLLQSVPCAQPSKPFRLRRRPPPLTPPHTTHTPQKQALNGKGSNKKPTVSATWCVSVCIYVCARYFGPVQLPGLRLILHHSPISLSWPPGQSHNSKHRAAVMQRNRAE